MSYTSPSPGEAAARRLALADEDPWNERALLSVFALAGVPPSHLDIGSGSGVMPRLSRRLGSDAVGVDVIAEPPDLVRDLTRPLDLGRRFALVTCIEVAEHLPPEAAPTLCDTLGRHTGDLLVFTSALPGQLGDHHQTLVPPFAWRGWLWAAGLEYDAGTTARLALLWTQTTGKLMHLPANLQVFRPRG